VKIELKYSCALCGITRVPCVVEERAAGEDIAVWMATVGEALSRDHDRRSPGCRPEKLSEVMIPLPDEGSAIGSRNHRDRRRRRSGTRAVTSFGVVDRRTRG
jgi:hypothetical protein